MIVVSNTSPIINLAAIDQINILHKLYGNIFIPEAVYHEIVVSGVGQAGSKEVQRLDWVKAQKASNQSLIRALLIEVDRGEAEAIALCLEMNANLLLIDERIGRTVASRLDLNYVGLLGLLVEAKSNGIIQKIEPMLDDLRLKAGFWISQPLYSRILKYANEQ